MRARMYKYPFDIYFNFDFNGVFKMCVFFNELIKIKVNMLLKLKPEYLYRIRMKYNILLYMKLDGLEVIRSVSCLLIDILISVFFVVLDYMRLGKFLLSFNVCKQKHACMQEQLFNESKLNIQLIIVNFLLTTFS